MRVCTQCVNDAAPGSALCETCEVEERAGHEVEALRARVKELEARAGADFTSIRLHGEWLDKMRAQRDALRADVAQVGEWARERGKQAVTDTCCTQKP